MRCTRFWAGRDKLLGFLLEPAENGGHAVVFRFKRLNLRLEADIWRNPR